MKVRFFPVLLILCNLTLCKKEPDRKGSPAALEKTVPATAVVNVAPALAFRAGPTLKSEILQLIPFETRVDFIKEHSGPDETILGLTGKWCNISHRGIEAWGFCPLLNFHGDADEGFVVRDGRAVHRSSKLYRELARSDECLELENGFQNFSGGCFGSPCQYCDAQVLRPDGRILEVESTVNGCELIGQGVWNAKDDSTIQLTYRREVYVHARDACVPPDSEEYKAAQATADRFGKSSAELEIEMDIALSDSGFLLSVSAKDPAQLPGKESIADWHVDNHNRLEQWFRDENKKRCFYPYVPVAYQK